MRLQDRGVEYPVYLVNLDSATERRERMERLLGRLGLPYDVVPAVHGRKLTEEELRAFEFHNEMDLGPGEYGCLLSHVSVWERFLATGKNCCFVLEDDLHFAEALDCAWLAALPAGEPWALKLETFFNSVTIGRQPVARFNSRSIHELLSPHAGTGSYAISRAGAQVCLSEYRKMRRAIDIELFSPVRRTIDLGKLTIYQMVPAPCLQDMFMPPPRRELAVASTIGVDRADYRELREASLRRKLIKRFRKLVRPAYRKACSLALWPKGRARISVRFR